MDSAQMGDTTGSMLEKRHYTTEIQLAMFRIGI